MGQDHMTAMRQLQIPKEWGSLPLRAKDRPIVVLGGIDTGKTTLATFCYQQLQAHEIGTGLIDLDLGQNSLGMPTTVGLEVPLDSGVMSRRGRKRHWRCFVGGISPVGCEPRLLSALVRLRDTAQQIGIRTLVVDTSGFISVERGAAHLKWAMIDVLRPCLVLALQRDRELEPIVEPLRHQRGVEVWDVPVVSGLRSRSREERRAYRQACYRRYFARARRWLLSYGDLACFAHGAWRRHQLLALEDDHGFVVRLALFDGVAEGGIWLRTPALSRGRRVTAVRPGRLWLEPGSYREHIWAF